MRTLVYNYINNPKSGGITLLICTIASLLLANIFSAYIDFWHLPIFDHSITHWINDGLMTIFFLLVGLELKQEMVTGTLSNPKRASLPAIAALGGMIFPAAFYFLFNPAGEATRGIGVPTATDIAFALGILSLLGSRVPVALKVFVTALAVIDDLGAILLIALFYTSTINWTALAIAGGIFVLLLFLNNRRVYHVLPYLLAGVVMWYFMLHSGIHATLTGVLIAFVIPINRNYENENATAGKLQHLLHAPVTFIILPLFALANTAIALSGNVFELLSGSISLGIMAGLFIGKPAGIFLFSYAAIKTNISAMPLQVKWQHLFGAGMLGGIGFTMSIFISILAFTNPAMVDQSKISVLIASMLSAIAGFIWLRQVLK